MPGYHLVPLTFLITRKGGCDREGIRLKLPGCGVPCGEKTSGRTHPCITADAIEARSGITFTHGPAQGTVHQG